MDEVRELAASELRPIAEAGEQGRVNRDLIRTMGQLGLLSRLFPGVTAQRGTRTVPAAELCLLWEALATESTVAARGLVEQGMGTYPVMRFGQAEQVQRWLPAVAAGDAVAALAIAEPGRLAGLREPVMDLIMEPDGADWRLSGEKTWVCNAPEADFYTVFARMGPDSESSGISAFVVPAIRPGISGERLEVTGAHPVGWLSFDGVPVVQEDMLGAPGQGLEIAARTAAAFRPSAGALALGIARCALEIAAAHATVGGPSGAPSGRQSITQLLAEMATRTEAARLLVYAAAAASDAASESDTASGAAEAPARWQAAMGTLYATETAQFVVDAAMQIVGADSLLRGHLLESLSREVRATRLCEGPADVQYGIIASELLS